MRIAILSDIHGNSIALDAVLADLRSQSSVDAIWVLGDLAAIGPDPVGVLERLSTLENAVYVRGNTDKYVTTGERPGPTIEEARADPRRLATLVELERSFSWTQGAVTAAGRFDWLAALPLELRLTLPNGTRLLGVHASPGQDDGSGFHPGLSAEQERSLLSGCNANLVCVGHTHTVLDIEVDGVRVVNPGSVSNPFPPDLRASYAILDADATGYRIQHQRVDYNRDAVIAMVRRMRHPAAEYVTQFMLGQNEPAWRKQILRTNRNSKSSGRFD